MRRIEPRSVRLLLAIFVLSAGVFVIDLLVPLGAAVYIPYIIAVILASHVPRRSSILITALACTALAVLGMVLSPAGFSTSMAFTNRGLVIAVIWVTALLVRQRQALYQALQEERDSLEQRVEARTAELADEIAERQAAQDVLQQQRDLLRVTLTSIGDAVLATDTQGRVTFLNLAAQTLTGWSADEALGREHGEVFQVVHEHTRQPLETPIAQVLQQGTTISLANHAALLSCNGHEAIIADSGAPIRDSLGRLHGAVLVFRDVTREKHLEDELIRARKLESVGTLAAGIAHDFNNLLAVIMGNLSMTQHLALPEENLTGLAQAQDACERATSLTRQLLAFSQGGAPVRRPMDLTELIVEAAQFAMQGSNVRCAFDLEAALWPAHVDAGQIHQVIHNVVLNAVQAMPEGGTVEIRAQNQQLTEGTALPLEVSQYVRIAVEDHGSGIAGEDLRNIFDPYFTTKPQGSGLGLATAYAIVSRHDGHMTVTSEVGRGTTIGIYLPASQEPALPVQELPSTPPDTLVGGRGRILVLDDEDLIRRMLQAMLPTLGYDVTCVSSGTEAIDSYREALAEGQPYAAVILDLTIPGGMGGREVLTHLQALDPDIKALASSGYTDDPVMVDDVRSGFRGMVPKPYTIETLSAELQRVLSLPSGHAPSQTTQES